MKWCRLYLWVGIGVGIAAGCGQPYMLRAQSPAPPATSQVLDYDVATVRLSKSTEQGMTMNTRLATLSASNVTLIYLLENAYGMPGFLITGVPKEMSDARFDLNAKVVEPDETAMRALTSEQRRDMLRRLLIERFHLKTHTEEKKMRVYDLVATEGARKLTPTTKLDAKGQPMRSRSLSMSDGVLNALSATCADLADALSGILQMPVIDRTGIDRTGGRFDVSLRWSPDDKPGVNPDSPSLSSELASKTGFKLRPDTGTVTVLVIDHAELPTAN